MGALTVSDLSVLAAEPLIRDVVLGQRLGMAKPTNIRGVIEANRAELEGYGTLHAARAMITAGKGAQRHATEFHLNEPQALLICMLSRTERAADVRRELICVFMTWRRGELAQQQPDPIERRLAAIEQIVARQPVLEGSSFARTLAHLLPTGRTKRFPKFWPDIEVRELLVGLHRQCDLHAAHRLLVGRVGPERTPSVSAIHRFWMQLDRVRTGRGLMH